VVATITPGQIVGELEVMTGTPRVASLVAVEEALLLEIPADKLDQLLRLNRRARTSSCVHCQDAGAPARPP